ncbi:MULTISPECIES: hypothetical protein [unclassified Novosphingobium]|uniref:hypothetical protein n=1 Tax=unclassified Novosphingobium TaxID=2644732 RepID=UPI0013576FB1|nr:MULTISPECIES: hypothetical protein [unclassified Novosphingobium]
MKRHFQLLLEVSADDLMILTAFLEHAYDRAHADPDRIPRPLAQRLREVAAADPTDAAFQYLAMVAQPEWEIADVAGDTLTIASVPGGASLADTVELLGRLAPSCLAAAFVYQPIEAPQASQGRRPPLKRGEGRDHASNQMMEVCIVLRPGFPLSPRPAA